MNPEALLSVLIQTHLKVSDTPYTPFLLQRNTHDQLVLTHPMMPEGGLAVDAETHHAFQTLVKWGYLIQPEQPRDAAYIVTKAGVNYSTRDNDLPWDGSEQRRQQGASGRHYPANMDRRREEA